MKKLIKKKYRKYAAKCIVGMVLVAIVLISVSAVNRSKKSKGEMKVVSTFEKLKNINELSTFQVVYNGIAEVVNKENTEDVDYYVSYMSKVNAGIDFKQLTYTKDSDTKTFTVNLPEIVIMDVNVDITSLDYLFYNQDADNETVSQEAYKACLEDVKKESSSEKEIYQLAEENAKNILKGLVDPFVKQLGSEYVLEIK